MNQDKDFLVIYLCVEGLLYCEQSLFVCMGLRLLLSYQYTFFFGITIIEPFCLILSRSSVISLDGCTIGLMGRVSKNQKYQFVIIWKQIMTPA
jgi:hypothetical protein